MKNILFVILSILGLNVFGSHISGGQITYQCLGNNVYQVKLTYFWDCAGGFNPGTQQTIDVDGCAGGQNLSLTVLQSSLTPGDGILAGGLCPTASTLTTCKKRIDYIGTITLPVGCGDWSFSLGSCCRGGNFSNITNGSSASYYHFATLNNTLTPCNNSPDIAIEQLPNFCVNQPACFNLGATESDGNTLTYAFISAYETSNTFVTYSGTYTGASPMTGITIDANTGQVNFIPTTVGDFVVTVQITETDANGNIIGTIMRDFQVIVTNCTNQTVTCGQGNITNVTSGTVPGGVANTLQICENIPFCFDVNFTDPDVTDSIKITSPNMATALPGSSMVLTYTPGITNAVKAHICWTPPAGSAGENTNFVLVVKDNACPVSGTQILNYIIDVLPATNAGPDQIICGAQTATVNAVGSSTIFAWTDLSGAPVPVGPEFSCNPCKNPTIKPAVTSTYVVTNINGGSNCKNQDTLVINVVPDFTLTAGVSIASGCLNSAVQFTSTIAPNTAGYTYSWSPSAPLTSTNTANTSATYSTSGTYNYTLSATSSLGCKKIETNIVFVANPVVTPVFTVVPTNTLICANTNVPLDISFGAGNPTSCGLANTGCSSPNVITVGNGTSTNGTTTYPSPYGNFYDSQHFQMLFTAAELATAGVSPGKISSLAFNVSALNSFANTLKNYTIKLKCTAATNATTFDVAGLSQVYSNVSQAVITGWNTHSFSQAYEWDGSSNLLIDICYDDNGLGYTQNPSSPYTTTGFTSVVWYRQDNTNTCPLVTITGTSSNRPNVKFGNCLSSADPNSFSYSWLPTTGLSNPGIKNPTTNVANNIIYTVVVTPTAAATCFNSGTTSLTVTPPITPTITPAGPFCSNASSLSLTAFPTGGTWSLTATTNSLGVFTPSLATIGSNTVSYTFGGAGCMQTSTTVVNIEKFVPSTITGTIIPQCNTNPSINLSTTLITSTLGVGTWAGNGVTGTTFDPLIAGAGIHTLTYNTNSLPTTSLCPSTSSLIVSVSSIVQPTITPAGPYCDNFAPQTMTVTPTSTTGVWSSLPAPNAITVQGAFNPAVATLSNNIITYTVSSGPCTASTTVIVEVVHFIPATITGSVGPYCIYDALENLQATAQFTGGVWSGNGVTGSDFTPSLAGAGTHVVTYSTNPLPLGLCPDVKTLSILVNAKPQANALSNQLSGCAPLDVNLFSSTVNTGNATWNFGDGTTASGLTANHTYTAAGTYSASISYTDAIGCVNDSAVANSFTVHANPFASFEPSLFETTVVDAQLEFTNFSTTPNTNTYLWDISGLATYTTTNSSYLFTDAGTFTISLTATTIHQCVDDTSVVIVVKPDVVLYVPNAFTPGNGDNLNDEFQIFLPPTGVDYSSFSLNIYDRWGTKVYYTNDVTKSWDGSKNNSGTILKEGVYIWKISFKDMNKKLYEKVGHVTLLSQQR